jgi:hypothetical protein
MPNKVANSCLCALLIVFFSLVSVYGAKPIAVDTTLPPLTLNAPESEQARQYLGLKTDEPFALAQIPARLVLVEVFYILCLECQGQAPNYNKLFSLIQDDPELSKDLRMVGVGIRSDSRKLQTYKKSFRVKFPLIPDPENEAYVKLGEPPIPFLLLVDSKGKVLLTHHGAIKDIEEFFREVRKLSKKA